MVVAQAPHRLSVDPSGSHRLNLNTLSPSKAARRGFSIRRLQTRADIAAINTLYCSRRMAAVDPIETWARRADRKLVYVLAEDQVSGEIVGVA